MRRHFAAALKAARSRCRPSWRLRLEVTELEPWIAPATVSITSAPPYGTAGSITGVVSGVNFADYRVAPYLYVDGYGWVTKPSANTPTVPINGDGTFSANVATGGVDTSASIFGALLYPAGVTPPLALGSGRIPASPAPVASNYFQRPGGTFTWADLTWAYKEAPLPVGPGSNRFSNLASDVFVDSQGQLHLTIHQRGGVWYSTEVYLLTPLGYGSYSFRTSSNVNSLPANVVFGGFTWDPYGTGGPDEGPNREIDSEDGFPSNGTTSQFVVQPFGVAGNLYRYTVADGELTRSIRWEQVRVEFLALRGRQGHNPSGIAPDSVIAHSLYVNDPSAGHFVPTPGQAAWHFNLWLDSGTAPVGGQAVEVVISDFAYSSNPVVLSAPTINGGAAQRSRVTSLAVTFNTTVDFASTPDAAFALTRNGGGAVNFTAAATVVGGNTVVTLSNFTGLETAAGSLTDGRYTLTALAGQIAAGGRPLDGNGDGTAGDDYVFADSGTTTGNQLYRLFGDGDGNRVVNQSDLTLFRVAFGSSDPTFDVDGNGVVNQTDLSEFRLRFGVST
jgi:hypothetical protein